MAPRTQPNRRAPTQIEDLDQLTGKLMRYIMKKDRKKLPARTADIKKYILNNRASDFKAVLNNATMKFNKIFGFELRHVHGAPQYFLVNKIANSELAPTTSRAIADEALLFLTLSYIFMCSESKEKPIVKEDDLWTFFMNLNIISDNHPEHPYFGNVKDLITNKFIKQLYLNKKTERAMDTSTYEWGPRAEAEITRRAILQFVSKIYQNRKIDSWTDQYQAMKISERSLLQQLNDDPNAEIN